MNHWEIFYLKLIHKKDKGFFYSFLRFLLWGLSLPYRLYMKGRNFAYDQGWLIRYSPPIPLVISIGNIVAGGVGKTPVTLMVSEAFYNDFPLAILSRGYRSESEKFSTPVIISRGNGPTHSAAYAGDEAYLLAENLPKAFVVVGKNRRESSCIASKLGARLIVLDDAMQHRRIQRDKEIVVLDLNDPWGIGFHLPRGLLRESKSGLKRADLLILNHYADKESFDSLKLEVSKYTSAPVVGTKMAVQGVYNLANNEVSLTQEKVAIFCGIAHPRYFAKTVQELKGEIVSEFFVGDHKAFTLDSLTRFNKIALAAGAKYLVCTEKDKVKLTLPTPDLLPIVWVKVKLTIMEGQEAFDDFIKQGKDLIRLHG